MIPGQFRELASVILTRAISPRSSVATQWVHGPRHASTHPRADARAGNCCGNGAASEASDVRGHRVEHLPHDRQRLLHLPRPNHQPRPDVASLFDGNLESQTLRRRRADGRAGSPCPPPRRARPSRQSRDLERPVAVRIPVPSTRSVKVPASMSTVIRSSNSFSNRVEMLPKRVESLGQDIALEPSQRNRRLSSIACRTARPASGRGASRKRLRATRGHGERDVGGDAADVGRVVVHALEFEQHDPQGARTRRHLDMPARRSMAWA